MNDLTQMRSPSSSNTFYHEPLARVIAQALPAFDVKFIFAYTFYSLLYIKDELKFVIRINVTGILKYATCVHFILQTELCLLVITTKQT